METRRFSLFGVDPLPPLHTSLTPAAVRREIDRLARRSGGSRAERFDVRFDGDYFELRRTRSRLEIAAPSSLSGQIRRSAEGSVITGTIASRPGAVGYAGAFVASLFGLAFGVTGLGVPLLPAMPLMALVIAAACVIGVARGNNDRAVLEKTLRALVQGGTSSTRS